MTKPLRALLVEDNADDELLIVNALRRGGYDVTHERVETREEMQRALAQREWDVVLSDYALPRFHGPHALQTLKESGLDLPFIMLSGTVDEETAVAALHAGAHDFIVKSKLARLIPAIEREMNDAAARRAHREAAAEVKQLEEQVRQAQKMEAIGRLAGGVAHDFNNILTAILATADLALTTPSLDESLKSDLENIREAGQRAAAITRQLLAFSRKQVVKLRPMDLNETVEHMEPLLKRLLSEHTRLETRLAATGLVEADSSQIEQVLLNLVVNANDAMPKGGVITVETADFETTFASNNRGKTLPPGKYLVLRVRDAGIGMDEDTLQRIFEPFFTTKEAGKGTGLGLSTVYGIVNQTGGQVFVHSRPGEGSVFEVCLPRMDIGYSVADVSTTSKSDQSNTRGSEVILIVEDEAQIRAPISRALRERGYFVLEAKNGNDALDVLQQYHAPVHLVVSDVVMPEMSGTELVQLLHAWYPTLKVLFVSGKMPDTATTAALGSTATYMAKPFTAEELARQVRNILDDGNGRRNSASVRHP